MYKYSIYNNIVILDDGTKVLYNSMSHAILKLKENLPPSITSLPTKIKEEFVKNGVIVDNHINEYEIVLKRIKENLITNKYFNLIINPTLNCNCRCWYCIEKHPQSKMSEETISQVKSLVLKILPTVQGIVLSFFGGEPFLEFQDIVSPLMQWANDLCISHNKRLSFVFTSNSLLLNQTILNTLSKYDNISFQITLDGNREKHNKVRKLPNGDSYLRIINNIKELTSLGINVLLRLNITHDNIHSIQEIAEEFVSFSTKAKHHITLTCQQVWQDVSNGKLYTQFFDIYKRFAEIGIYPNDMSLDFVTGSCYADKLNDVLVNYNGDLYKCTALEYNGNDHIGNINTHDTLELLSKNFKEFVKSKTSNTNCQSCRVFPLCTKGCYKYIMINKENCLYPTDKDKDLLVKNNLELIAFLNYIKILKRHT